MKWSNYKDHFVKNMMIIQWTGNELVIALTPDNLHLLPTKKLKRFIGTQLNYYTLCYTITSTYLHFMPHNHIKNINLFTLDAIQSHQLIYT